jgi:hypothetical protein
MPRLASSIAVAAIVMAFNIPAAEAAQVLTTWVSHNGSDASIFNTTPCTAPVPCGSFPAAIFSTNPGGEVNCLDNGDYGNNGGATGTQTTTIDRSLIIDCGAQGGTVNVSGAINGIIINGANIAVKLRGLTINGNGSSGTGILIQNARSVTIENCVIQGFNGTGGTGILVSTSNGLQLNVTDTLITDNTNGSTDGGIVINPTGSAATTFAFDRIRVEGNATAGILALNQSTGPVTGVIRDSEVSGSAHSGVFANTSIGQVTVSLDHTQVAGNGTGITAANGVAVILNNSTVQTNGTGLVASGGGGIFSYGNNAINGNQPGGIGTAPILIGLH